MGSRMAHHDQSSPRSAAVPTTWGDPSGLPRTTSVAQRWGPLLVWSGCLAVALVLLLWLGDGRLATPAVTAPSTWREWAATNDPLTVVTAVLRVLALGLAWYLTGITSISVVARALRAARLVRVADALAFGPVRTLAQQAMGVGLAAGVLVTAVPTAGVGSAGDEPAATDVVSMVPIDTHDEVVAATAPSGMALREPAPAPVPAPVPVPASAATASAAPADDPAPASLPVRERRVAPGDHFWAIAESEVTDHLGRTASEAEVLAHWEDLVAANTDRLAVPGNPDLLVPGQRILLPEVAS